MNTSNHENKQDILSKSPIKNIVLSILIIVIFLVTNILLAQVGVGNTNPQATLDISASDINNPTNTDGVLIPRVDNFPSTAPTGSQEGMLLFYTGTAADGKGFYYWDQSTTSWMKVNNTPQDLTLNGDQLDISGGSSASMRAFINPKYPDGFENIEPITLSNINGSNQYTVPSGKNLFVTNVLSNAGNNILVVNTNLAVFRGAENLTSLQSMTNPLIFGSGDIIRSFGFSGHILSVNGFLVDAFCQPISFVGTYTVPAGKVLVILNGCSQSTSSSSPLEVSGTNIYIGSGNNKNTQGLVSFLNPIFVNAGESILSTLTLNGYLIDN